MKDKILEEFENFCTKNELKKTTQRYAVFKYIYKNRNHPCVEDVLKAVKEEIPMITADSVYRILNDFQKANLIDKLAQSSITRYDSNTENHSHFICTNCNKITDIYDLKLDLPKELKDCKNLSITINALCKDCAKL